MRSRARVLVWVLTGLAGGALLTGAIVGVSLVATAHPGPTATPQALSPTPTAPPSSAITPTAAQQLLADTDDPLACAVTFVADGVAIEPALQTQDAMYLALPIPERADAVFAGWYDSLDAAAAQETSARINGADPVSCVDSERTLYGAWSDPSAVAAADVAVPILMYHQFTTRPEGEPGWLRLNYAYIGDVAAQWDYLAREQFYLPTWDELAAFIDGRLALPLRSVVITDDDADPTWFELAVPLLEEDRLLATSFVITKWRHDPSPSRFVLQRSHTHDMHEAGADGRGRMVNWDHDGIVGDLEYSAQILGATEVLAYPFGHYDDDAKRAVHDAGFEMARTIDPGYVRAGTDKLALPVIRINYGMTLDQFIAAVG